MEAVEEEGGRYKEGGPIRGRYAPCTPGVRKHSSWPAGRTRVHT